tara:strand:- start:600 stop:1217 length:618 start_codon:yes stop_codon:yes gene_type:complete
VPIELITYYDTVLTHGEINISNVNLRDIPLVKSTNSIVLKKIEKSERVEIKKVFFLKGNTPLKLKMLNSNKYEDVNNYRFSKWYLASYQGEEGFIFSDYVTLDKISKKHDRYRHIKSIDWTNNKVELQENIEIEIVNNDQDNLYEVQGYAWHFSKGFYRLNQIINKELISKNSFIIDDFKIFFFDKDEIYLESDIKIFTGIYKRY